jgi:hypothetical protein
MEIRRNLTRISTDPEPLAIQNRLHLLSLDRIAGRAMRPLEPVVELPHADLMGDFGLSHGHSYVAGLKRSRRTPVLALQCLHSSCHGLI